MVLLIFCSPSTWGQAPKDDTPKNSKKNLLKPKYIEKEAVQLISGNREVRVLQNLLFLIKMAFIKRIKRNEGNSDVEDKD